MPIRAFLDAQAELPNWLEAPPLALKKGIDTPTTGCTRWPERLRLLNLATGELVRGRCKATNLCGYCRRLAAAETVEMLVLDAMVDPPDLVALLTAANFPRGDELRRTLAKIVKACRRRWPEFEWFVPRERHVSGQHHIHPLIKHVPTDDATMRELYELITRIWCERHPSAIAYPYELRSEGPQGLKVVHEGQGLVRYLTKELAHSLKNAQALADGFRGHRTSQTRGYFAQGATAAREVARESLRRRRHAWTLSAAGLTAEEVALELELGNDDDWQIWQQPGTADPREYTQRRPWIPAKRLLEAEILAIWRGDAEPASPKPLRAPPEVERDPQHPPDRTRLGHSGQNVTSWVELARIRVELDELRDARHLLEAGSSPAQGCPPDAVVTGSP